MAQLAQSARTPALNNFDKPLQQSKIGHDNGLFSTGSIWIEPAISRNTRRNEEGITRRIRYRGEGDSRDRENGRLSKVLEGPRAYVEGSSRPVALPRTSSSRETYNNVDVQRDRDGVLVMVRRSSARPRQFARDISPPKRERERKRERKYIVPVVDSRERRVPPPQIRFVRERGAPMHPQSLQADFDHQPPPPPRQMHRSDTMPNVKPRKDASAPTKSSHSRHTEINEGLPALSTTPEYVSPTTPYSTTRYRYDPHQQSDPRFLPPPPLSYRSETMPNASPKKNALAHPGSPPSYVCPSATSDTPNTHSGLPSPILLTRGNNADVQFRGLLASRQMDTGTYLHHAQKTRAFYVHHTISEDLTVSEEALKEEKFSALRCKVKVDQAQQAQYIRRDTDSEYGEDDV